MLLWSLGFGAKEISTERTGNTQTTAAKMSVQQLLTHEEREYLRTHREFTLCVDPKWMPYEKIDEQGAHVGMASELLALVTDSLGIRFRIHVTKRWGESLEAARAGSCQVLSFLNQTQERSQFLNFTAPIYIEDDVIVASNKVGYIKGLSGLEKKRLAVYREDWEADMLKGKIRGIQTTRYYSPVDAFSAVSSGDAFATISPMAEAIHIIRTHRLYNIKIAGKADTVGTYRIGVRKDEPMLHAILSKAVEVLDPLDKERIVNRYLAVSMSESVNYPLIVSIILGLIAVVAAMLFWNRKLHESREFIRSVLGAVSSAICVIDARGKIIHTNTMWDHLAVAVEASEGSNTCKAGDNYLRYCAQTEWRDVLHAIRAVLKGKREHFSLEHAQHFGSVTRWYMMIITPLSQGKRGAVIAHTEITERVESEEKMRLLAYFDPLTDLPNRRLFSDRLAQLQALSKRHGTYAMIMILDMDKFKSLNDRYGHDVGDQLLIEVAARLREQIRQSDTAARFGGDEFAVVAATQCGSYEEAQESAMTLAHKLHTALTQPYKLFVQGDLIEYPCGVSIGVGLFLGADQSEAALLKYADQAMYALKESGRNGVRLASKE
ncbi:MAG: diguanylate cyclase [Campylobacterales bacterium]|nr:diguanylate cyclase [Campylobacterales bacterium]